MSLYRFLSINITLLLIVVSMVSASWTRLGVNQDPTRQFGARAVYCKNRDSMVIFGGYRLLQDIGKFTFFSDIWEYSFANEEWTHYEPVFRPSPRVWYVFVALPNETPNACQAVMYGGYGRLDFSTNGKVGQLGDTWLLDLSGTTATWSTLETTDPDPGARYQSDGVARRGDLVLFGGLRQTGDETTEAFNDLWTLTMGEAFPNGTREVSTWSVTPQNTSSWPEQRYFHSMALDLGSTPDADQLVVYAGNKLDTPSTWSMLSDLLIYSFKTNSWRMADGLKLERSGHASAVFSGRYFAFGGVSRVQVSPRSYQSFLFNDVLVTNLNPGLNSVPSVPSNADVPQCVASDGTFGLWCKPILDGGEPVPALRFDMASVVRNDQLVIYGGGALNNAYDDFWALNMTKAVENLKLAEADELGQSDLASTMYFMIAILSMMVVCFMVFVISLRRQRNSGPIFQTMMVTRPRVLGARQSVIEALPLKTYRKKEAEERRQSRRQSRRESNRSTTAGDTGSNATSAAAMNDSSSAAAITPAADPNDPADRIDQDDLHDLCAICLTDYEDGESLRVLPCEHFFHPPCVDQWLRTHNACPMCKASVDPDPERGDETPAGAQVVVSPQSADNPAFGMDIEAERQQSSERVGESNATMADARMGESTATTVRMGDSTNASNNEVVIDLSAPSGAQANNAVETATTAANATEDAATTRRFSVRSTAAASVNTAVEDATRRLSVRSAAAAAPTEYSATDGNATRRLSTRSTAAAPLAESVTAENTARRPSTRSNVAAAAAGAAPSVPANEDDQVVTISLDEEERQRPSSNV